jgi:hypothetical protein
MYRVLLDRRRLCKPYFLQRKSEKSCRQDVFLLNLMPFLHNQVFIACKKNLPFEAKAEIVQSLLESTISWARYYESSFWPKISENF